jgi:uncharacterized protein (TIGR03085 family)
MPVPIDERERAELCDLFLELGPDAPTLCEGWTTADLAAHLSLREHFRRWGDERRATEKAKGYEAVVAGLRGGAPLVPWRLPVVRGLMNGNEWFVHHEDVRRANGLGRRADRPDLDDMAWRFVGLTGRRLARKVKPWGLELRRPGQDPKRFGDGDGAVLRGPGSELALYLSGRRQGVEVQLEGPPEAVRAVEQANLGL